MTDRNARYVALALLVLCCLPFFRGGSTRRSMVRAVLLEQRAEGWCVGLLAQAPEAAADTSETEAELSFVAAEGETVEKALADAEAALPQTANYRLCDYVLLLAGSGRDALEQYEALLARTQCGRTAAAVLAGDFSCEALSAASEEDSETALPTLLEQLKAAGADAPRLYEDARQTRGGLLLPCVTLEAGRVARLGQGVLLLAETSLTLDENTMQAALLLEGKTEQRAFWLDGQQVVLQNCVLSRSMQPNTGSEEAGAAAFVLRVDAIHPFGAAARLGDAQTAQLAALLGQTLRTLWAQGVDAARLSAFAAQRSGSALDAPGQSECPAVEVQICWLE
jgi:hypothetical protein